MEQCLNQEVLNATAMESVSCAKRGHKKTWYNTGKTIRGCGRCLPCIYRRAALHTVDLDSGSSYGRDICKGQVKLNSDKDLADDFRALVSFLHRDVSKQEIASLLLANGNIEVNRLMEYADVVVRSIDEVRTLLRNKGTDEIKQRAGLVS